MTVPALPSVRGPGATAPRVPHGAVRRALLTWLVASVLALAVLTAIALTIGGSIGPLEVVTAALIGMVVVVIRGRRTPDSRPS